MVQVDYDCIVRVCYTNVILTLSPLKCGWFNSWTCWCMLSLRMQQQVTLHSSLLLKV